jgi:hypothetical protein
MSSMRVVSFAKTRGCPSSHELLLLQSEAISPERSAEIISHLVGCDFCFAEVYFLSRHQISPIPYEPAEMPEHLRKLAVALLARPEFGFEGIS